MRRRGYTEEQILAASRQAKTGPTVAEICRDVGISEQTFYLWKRKYAGLVRLVAGKNKFGGGHGS